MSFYQLKITLEYSKPPIWRRFVVPADIELQELHEVVQIVMGWLSSHMHAFTIGHHSFMSSTEHDETDSEDETGIKLSSLIHAPKDWLRYEYDFGDGWEHKIELEKILDKSPSDNPVTCIKMVRACPPEDCGGVSGYEYLLTVLSNPQHPEYENVIDQVGEDFDPKEVDMAYVNKRLKELWDDIDHPQPNKWLQ